MPRPDEAPPRRHASSGRPAGHDAHAWSRPLAALAAALAAVLPGCGSAPAGPDPGATAVMTERAHAHRHPHGPGLDHGHSHADFPTGIHSHDHSGH